VRAIVHLFVNDGTRVNLWQDGNVDEQPPASEPTATRVVEDVESLRALADPIRIAILAALMETRHGDLPVMSVKELAATLGEPQTKLYRHVRQLEAAGLIKVAATRMVSGILEHRYQACQRDVTFGRGFLREHVDESEAVMQTLMNAFRDGFFTAFREQPSSPAGTPDEEAYRRPTLLAVETRVSPARAAQIRAKLSEVADWLNDGSGEDPDGMIVDILIGYFSPADRQSGSTSD
jgi:DNA-binding transcriptional ArsR family regulator